MLELPFRKMKCRGADEVTVSALIFCIRVLGPDHSSLKSQKMSQVQQEWARRAHFGLLLALILLVIGPSMAQATGPQQNNIGKTQKLPELQLVRADSNFTQKFSDKVQISKDTFVSVEEALQLLKSKNKVPHIKFGPKLEKVQLIGGGRLENKSPEVRLSWPENFEGENRPGDKKEKLTKKRRGFGREALSKALSSSKTVAVDAETDIQNLNGEKPDEKSSEKKGDRRQEIEYVTEVSDVKNILQFIGGADENYGDIGEGDVGANEDLEIQTESPPSWASGSSHRDCAVFVGNELVGVHRHGSSWSEGDDRCAICQCDDGEQRCYYHYCNGPELGFITPPSAKTPSAQEDVVGSSSENVKDRARSKEESPEEARNKTVSNEVTQPEEQSTKSSSIETRSEAIERLLAFDDDDYEYDLQSSGMPPWYYSDDEDGYFDDYDQDDYTDRHENYDNSLDLLPSVNTIHDHGDHDYEQPNRPHSFSSAVNPGSEAGGPGVSSSDGFTDCEADCGKSCPYGYKITPGAGCPTCKCLKCKPLDDCRLYCAAGYSSDTHGCPTCACATNLQEGLNQPPLNSDQDNSLKPFGQDHTRHRTVNQEDDSNHNHDAAANIHHTLGDITATHKFAGSFAGENNDVLNHDETPPRNPDHTDHSYKIEQNLRSDRHDYSNVESSVIQAGEHYSSVQDGERFRDIGSNVEANAHKGANVPHAHEKDASHPDNDVESNDIHADLTNRENVHQEKPKHQNGKKNKEQDPHNHFYDNAFNILKEDEVSILRDNNPDDSRDFHIDSLRLTPDDANDIFLKKNNDGESDFDDDDDESDDEDDATYGKYNRKYSEDSIPRSSHDLFAPIDYDLDFVTTEDDISTTVVRDEVDKHDKKASASLTNHKENCTHTPPQHCQDPSGARYPAGAVWYRGACTVCRCYGAGYAECTITQCSTAHAPVQCSPPAPGQCCPQCFGVPESSLGTLQSPHREAKTEDGGRSHAKSNGSSNGPSNGSSNGPNNGSSNGPNNGSSNGPSSAGSNDPDNELGYGSAFAADNSTVKEAVRSDISSICLVVLALVAVISVSVVVALRYWRRYHSAKYDIAATITCEEAQKLRPVKLSSSEQISDSTDVMTPLRPAKCV